MPKPKCPNSPHNHLYRITNQWYVVIDTKLDALYMYSFDDCIYYYIRGTSDECIMINLPTPTQQWHLRETRKLALAADWDKAIKQLKEQL